MKVICPLIFIGILVFAAGCVQQSQKVGMEFSSTKLFGELSEPSDWDIQQIWLNDTTLQVKGYMSIICGATIQDSSYEISGNKIKLIPNAIYPDPEKVNDETCMEPYELTYKFTNIEKKNYQIEFDEDS